MTNAELVRTLNKVGFYATANDVRAGRIDRREVASRLRRDAPNRVADNAKTCLALADTLDDQREM